MAGVCLQCKIWLYMLGPQQGWNLQLWAPEDKRLRGTLFNRWQFPDSPHSWQDSKNIKRNVEEDIIFLVIVRDGKKKYTQVIMGKKRRGDVINIYVFTKTKKSKFGYMCVGGAEVGQESGTYLGLIGRSINHQTFSSNPNLLLTPLCHYHHHHHGNQRVANQVHGPQDGA